MRSGSSLAPFLSHYSSSTYFNFCVVSHHRDTSDWYPNGTTHAQRLGIEGVYFLMSEPDISTSPIGPAPFKDGYEDDFNKCMKAVRRDWRPTEKTRIEWDEWFSNESPQSDTAAEYVARKGLDIPFRRFKEKVLLSTLSSIIAVCSFIYYDFLSTFFFCSTRRTLPLSGHSTCSHRCLYRSLPKQSFCGPT